jgi:hypothetical protein
MAQDAPPATAPAATAPAATQPPKDLPKAEDIIKAALDAMGTKKAYDDLNTIAIKAAMTTPMGDMTLDTKSAKTGSFLMSQELPGMGGSSMGYNGTIGWSHAQGSYQLLEKEQVEQVKSQSNLYRVVFNLMEDFPSLETVDLVKFNDMDCYKIRMVGKGPDAPTQFGYFAVEGKLMQGMEVSQESPMGEVKTIVKFSDWKKFEPLTLFTKLNIDQAGMQLGPMNINSVEFNNLEPSAFEPPAEVLELAKEKAAAAASQPDAAPATTKPAMP